MPFGGFFRSAWEGDILPYQPKFSDGWSPGVVEFSDDDEEEEDQEDTSDSADDTHLYSNFRRCKNGEINQWGRRQSNIRGAREVKYH